VQKDTAYLNVIGENIRDLFIGEGDLGSAKEGDLIIAKRLLGVRGTPKAKIVEIQHDEATKVIEPATAHRMKKILMKTVKEGTGYKAKTKGLDVGGKPMCQTASMSQFELIRSSCSS